VARNVPSDGFHWLSAAASERLAEPAAAQKVPFPMMNTQTSSFRWLAVLLSVTMLFGVVGPLVQQACASHATAVPVQHCAEMAGAHADRMDASDEAPMSDCETSRMDCCTVEAHASDRVDLRSPERIALLELAVVFLHDVDLVDDAAHVPLSPSDPVPDRPVRLHLWTATFLN
jgi:hypothetical protein